MQIKLEFSRWYTIANTRLLSNQSICKVWSCYVQWFRSKCIYKKVHYFTLTLTLRLRSRTNTKHCPVSSTSYDLCTWKVWNIDMSNGLGGNAFFFGSDLDPNSFTRWQYSWNFFSKNLILKKFSRRQKRMKNYPVGKESNVLTLNEPITTKVVCFSRLLKYLRSLYGKLCEPRSDCSYRSSLFWVHAVCFYT